MKTKKTISVFLVIGFCFLIFSEVSSAIGVRPLVMDFNLSPGERVAFDLNITPEETQRVVNINFFKSVQQLSGGLTYKEQDSDDFPALDWVQLEDDEVTVRPGEEKKVQGTINVPYDAEGSHTVVLMVEPAADPDQTGIIFQVRYAVRVNIHVDRPGLRPSVDVLDFKIEPDEENFPMVSANLKNPSPLKFPVSGEVTIRDESRRLVERVSVRSQHAWEGGREETSFYPGAEVLFLGPVNEPLFPGDYELRLFLRYADGRQIIRSQTVTVEEGQFAQHMEYLRLDPEGMQENLRPGAAVSKAFQFENRAGEPLIVQIGGEEIESDYEHSIFEFVEVQVRGEQEFELDSHRTGRQVITFRPPREIEPGGYYGKLQANVFSPEGDHLDSYTVPLDLVVGEGWENDAEIRGLEHEIFDENLIFSVDMRNLGKAHIVPEGTLYLQNQAGETLRTLRLELPEDAERVLPQQSGFLHVETGLMEPGEYIGEVVIGAEGEELDRKDFEIVIE